VLTKNGFAFLAYSLFLRQEYPGWLYEVNMGATTVWERWNSILPDGHISSTGMNSLNHYAYGSVMEWVYGDAAGLSPREDAPGFRKVSLAPHPDARLPEIAFQYESPVGRYVSETRVTGENTFEWKVEVPFGGEAELTLPRCDVKGNAVWHEENGRMKAIVPAGRYAFSCVFECAPWAAPLMDRTFAQLLLDPAIKEGIYQAAPHLDDLFAEKPADSITFRQLRMKDTPLIPASEMLALCELFKRLSFENA
jgi:alpha-L-rhamnosidase